MRVKWLTAETYRQRTGAFEDIDFRYLCEGFPPLHARYFAFAQGNTEQGWGVCLKLETVSVLAGLVSADPSDCTFYRQLPDFARTRMRADHRRRAVIDAVGLPAETSSLWNIREAQDDLRKAGLELPAASHQKRSGLCREAACRIICESEADSSTLCVLRAEWTTDLEKVWQKLDARILALPRKNITEREELIRQAHQLNRILSQRRPIQKLGEARIACRQNQARILSLEAMDETIRETLKQDLDLKLKERGLTLIQTDPERLTLLAARPFSLKNIFRSRCTRSERD